MVKKVKHIGMHFQGKYDDIVKSPYAALRFILRHDDVSTSTPHSSGLTRLASGASCFVVSIMTFYEFINIVGDGMPS